MKVFIVTEGIASTGYGHLTRCLALYQAFIERGIHPIFVVNCDEDGKKYLGNISFESYNWVEDKEKFFSQINGSEITIIDSYLASKEILERVSEIVKKAVYIDDYLRIDYPKGIIVNGTVGAESLPYKMTEFQEYLLGISYIPLRKEFWDIPKVNKKEKVQNVLLTFGGQDIRGLTFTILDFLVEEFSNFQYHVVLGSNFKSFDSVKYKGAPVALYSALNGKSMLELMLRCGLAISAAGQTTYELARVGTKMIAIGVVENQNLNFKGWMENGFLKKRIWYSDEDLFAQISSSIIDICNQPKRGQPVYCDGQGARRIIDALLCMK